MLPRGERANPSARRSARNAPDSGQLECGMAQIESGHQSEHVQLESFGACRADTEEAEDGDLPAGAARGPREELARGQIVLADRGRWKRQPELRNPACDVRDERVAVRAGPRAVAHR